MVKSLSDMVMKTDNGFVHTVTENNFLWVQFKLHFITH